MERKTRNNNNDKGITKPPEFDSNPESSEDKKNKS
jgi:hypothetical protein